MESFEARFERLAFESCKFYDVGAASILSVRQELDVGVIDEMFEWVDK